MISVGILYTYCVGPFVNYVLFQWLCLFIPVIFIAIFIFLPDTPYYFVAKGKREKAIKSLVFLRQSYREKVMDELEEIENSIAQSSQNNATVIDVFLGPNLKGSEMIFF